MTLIRYKDVSKMDNKERKSKLEELKFSLVKSSVAANRTNSKTKEIKRAIARILTFNASNKEVLKNKK
ncbi:MAG: hypothetical protein AABX59_02260 [Nanoarchaeota archaeon]